MIEVSGLFQTFYSGASAVINLSPTQPTTELFSAKLSASAAPPSPIHSTSRSTTAAPPRESPPQSTRTQPKRRAPEATPLSDAEWTEEQETTLIDTKQDQLARPAWAVIAQSRLHLTTPCQNKWEEIKGTPKINNKREPS